ncbi:MAG: DUF1573 domain-containing protein [Bacteroidales bacterium]|nr:DUF1573 domain-containing protein [Bacteroidales bacterium]
MKLFKDLLFTILICALIGLLSCNNKNDKIKNNEIAETGGYPIIKFDTTYHNFGTLIQGEKVAFTFYFKNTGTSNLIIKDAYSTCGCTVPNYSKEPIAPDKEGKIEVIFDSEGKRGLQYKTVTLKLNTERKEKTLTIKANVLENNYKS